MKKTLLALALFTSVFGFQQAHADIIVCKFTEPFVKVTYSMAQMSLTIEPAGEESTVMRGVSFQILGDNKFELLAKDNSVLAKLELSGEGSDGMSDIVYPFDVKGFFFSNLPQVGGCESNKLRAKNPNL